ncbi:MAG TPA: glycosyltransferase family 4 protein [Armatimonadota bacterium]|nr:glycosyltransferase family 4 protein [Armatimonadota bacterium]
MSTRIAFVTESLNLGGTETFMLRLGRYLMHHDCDVHLITTLRPGVWFDQADVFQLPHVTISGYDYSIPVIHAWNIGRYLVRQQYDVVFLNHDHLAQAIIGMLPNTTVAIPIFHSEHSKQFNISCANSACWNVAVAVGPQLAASVSACLPHKPIVTIPNGVEGADPAMLSHRKPFALPLQLLYIGRLERAAKNTQILPVILDNVCHRGVPVHLTLIGEGPEHHRLEAAFREYGLEEHVTFLGAQQPNHIYKYLLNSHALLFPSLSEGFGLVAAEAQACGCVPIASRLQGSTEVCVRDGETGILVQAGNPDEFTNAIEALATSPERWAAMSQAGPLHVHERLSLDVIGQAYLRLIDDALHDKFPLAHPRKCMPHRAMLHGSDYCFVWTRRLERAIRAWIRHK